MEAVLSVWLQDIWIIGRNEWANKWGNEQTLYTDIIQSHEKDSLLIYTLQLYMSTATWMIDKWELNSKHLLTTIKTFIVTFHVLLVNACTKSVVKFHELPVPTFYCSFYKKSTGGQCILLLERFPLFRHVTNTRLMISGFFKCSFIYFWPDSDVVLQSKRRNNNLQCITM